MSRLSLLLVVLLLVPAFLAAETVDVRFEYADSTASHVSVAGSFNGWNAAVDSLTRVNGVWQTTIALQPGYYYYKFVVDGNWIPDPKNPSKVNDGGDSYNSILKAGKPPVPRRLRNSEPLPKARLPLPILPGHPEWLDLYWAAWEMLWGKIAHGTDENGFVATYLDEGFNEQVYQWDSCFMAMFAMYGRDVFPAMAALDNFYAKQRADGYIQRVYQEMDGTQVTEPTAAEPLVNPPLFAWVEWTYAVRTGDTSRVHHVLPHLIQYHRWLSANCRGETDSLLFFNTPLGSGMDNVPRHDTGHGAWIDMSAQMAFAANSIGALAALSGDSATAISFETEAESICRRIDEVCWDETRSAFTDVSPEGTQNPSLHVGMFWPLLACGRGTNTDDLIATLLNPDHFLRPHMVPALAASDPQYSPRGHYWRGGVWAPTNYMVVRGLEAVGHHSAAVFIAQNHLENMSAVYTGDRVHEDSIAFEQRYADGYHTIWECYAPERPAPATRWDNTFYSRQDFVGWSGLGPIAMLLETIIGIDTNALENEINWRISQDDLHGVENLAFGEQHIDLLYNPLADTTEVLVTCESPFRLSVRSNDCDTSYNIANSGTHSFKFTQPTDRQHADD